MKKIMTGNEAAAYVSYAFTEIAAIYPITPSTAMGEFFDKWSNEKRKNLFNTVPKVIEMQSEAGASAVMHGSLQTGALSTSFTASQGLLLMIPNMYKMSGELLPGVLHIAARSISTHALSIFGDHQDVYSARSTGFAMLASNSVQEVMDLAAIAHLSSIKGRVPFMHFFDGFRTSHEMQNVEVIDYEVFDNLLDKNAVNEFRNRALNSNTPVTRGSSQTEDIYFQVRESQNIFYNKIPDIVDNYMKEINKVRKTNYAPFMYYGAEDAEYVIVAMGSTINTIREVVEEYNKMGEKYGVMSVHLYRPFSEKYFLDKLPKTVKKIAVLDKTKESGSIYEPLALDIKAVNFKNRIEVIGGRYGLSSKDTTPSQIVSVFNNLKLKESKDNFTIGIKDDVTFTSLPETYANYCKSNNYEVLFYGLGSDGTVGASKNTVTIIGEKTPLNVQAYFLYDSNKALSVTRSYLRFSNDEILSEYLIEKPDFVICSIQSYLDQYNIIKNLKQNSKLLINTMFDKEKFVDRLTNRQKKDLASKNIEVYLINATKLSYKIGIPNRTNVFMQTAFFYLSNIIDFEIAKEEIKNKIIDTYSKKGEDIVSKNIEAIKVTVPNIVKVDIDKNWADFKEELDEYIFDPNTSEMKKYLTQVFEPQMRLEGGSIPVSTFSGREDGTLVNGTTKYDKRQIASQVPRWRPEHCIQCNQCAYVCPHATIRPFLLDNEELELSPNDIETLKAQGRGLENLRYRIQVSPLDCTGCKACADVCPVKNKALIMVPIEEELERHEDENADYLYNQVSYKTDNINKFSVKGSQFAKPLFEFSGACAGCGETTYIKLLTQLYGDRLIISNATGCSSIYGASAPLTPYTVNEHGEGPAWSSSLFEDNAEYGYGMYKATNELHEKVTELMKEYISNENLNNEFKILFENLLNQNDIDEKQKIKRKIYEKFETEIIKDKLLEQIYNLKKYIVKQEIWIIGGDGWAYDIGFGGLDHVLSSGDNVNILVLDTEVYSNTGGQTSKATPLGASAKFSSNGKRQKKKDLAALLMAYENIYIAKVAMGANQNQTLRALKEASEFNGPSIVIAYAPCIEHGIKGGLQAQSAGELAVSVGYWTLLRYNPDLIAKGRNPLQIDSRKPDFSRYMEFLMTENRFKTLLSENEEMALNLFEKNKQDAINTYKQYKRLSKLSYKDEEEVEEDED